MHVSCLEHSSLILVQVGIRPMWLKFVSDIEYHRFVCGCKVYQDLIIQV